MFAFFRRAFLEPRGERWFSQGLIIESASAKGAERALAKLADVLPYIRFDLLSRRERSGPGLGHVFRVKRPLGGLRLLIHARHHYDLVVLFATGERELWLCRTIALLVMRPERFFVFNEFGDGFWLHRDTASQLRMHLEMRWDWNTKRMRWHQRWEGFVAALLRLVRLPPHLLLGLSAGLLFLLALLLLALLRATYDTHSYRFRFFGKRASAPRRDLDVSNAPQTGVPPATRP